MATTKKQTQTKPAEKKVKVGKPPTLAERITDFSADAYVGKPIYTPRKKK